MKKIEINSALDKGIRKHFSNVLGSVYHREQFVVGIRHARIRTGVLDDELWSFGKRSLAISPTTLSASSCPVYQFLQKTKWII